MPTPKQPPIKPADYDITTALQNAGVSITQPRLAVYHYLKRHGSVTHTDLIAGLKTEIDRASVYRTLGLFTEHHIAQEVIIGGVRKVELTDRFHHHHHHFSCDNCGCVVSFGSLRLEKALKAVAIENQFQERTHQIEITGLCARCS